MLSTLSQFQWDKSVHLGGHISPGPGTLDQGVYTFQLKLKPFILILNSCFTHLRDSSRRLFSNNGTGGWVKKKRYPLSWPVVVDQTPAVQTRMRPSSIEPRSQCLNLQSHQALHRCSGLMWFMKQQVRRCDSFNSMSIMQSLPSDHLPDAELQPSMLVESFQCYFIAIQTFDS